MMSEYTGKSSQPADFQFPQRSNSDADPSDKPSEEKRIKQVDLKKYEFSPPGPMGWTVKEYEKMIDSLQNKKEG